MQQPAGKIGIGSGEGEAHCSHARERKLPQLVAKIGCQEIVQQAVAQFPWGRFLCLLNKKPVGIDILRESSQKGVSHLPEGSRDGVRLGLFPRSGFTKEIEALGKKGEVDLIDVRKIDL